MDGQRAADVLGCGPQGIDSPDSVEQGDRKASIVVCSIGINSGRECAFVSSRRGRACSRETTLKPSATLRHLPHRRLWTMVNKAKLRQLLYNSCLHEPVAWSAGYIYVARVYHHRMQEGKLERRPYDLKMMIQFNYLQACQVPWLIHSAS